MDAFSKYHFKDLNEGEEIVRVIHRNWFYLLEQFFLIFIISIFSVAGFFVAPLVFPEMFSSGYGKLIAFAENFFVLSIWIYCFLIWIDYYFDVWIITTERIINIEQKGMFTREVSELRYEKIQDVTTEVCGFISTIINFGDVRVQTAGEQNEFVFKTVSDPYQVKNIIMELQKKIETKKVANFGEMIKKEIEG